MDIFGDISWLKKSVCRVETERFGPFLFEPGVALDAVHLLCQRVEDAQQRFKSSPLAQVANALEKEVVVSSVFGTNTIEGGALDEAQIQYALDLDPALIEEEQQRRVVNIKAAYELAKQECSQADWQPTLAYICSVHHLITEGLVDENNVPGQLRDNPKSKIMRVGDGEHGGVYKPPQNGRDVAKLLAALIEWNQSLAKQGVPALVRAPLFHLYFEWIHPFWDGNGRVGRVLEASILLAAGFRYAPFAQANYYLNHIHQYFALFNHCRKQGENTAFVAFFLEGMLESINRLHNRVNALVELLLFRNLLRDRHESRDINPRQYAIAVELLNRGAPVPLDQFRASPWYKVLYNRLTSKTMQRDMRQLRSLGLIHLDEKDRLWPGCIEPDAEIKRP